MTKVSIILPALNEEEGIRKTILAIPFRKLGYAGYQTELIVVDNGSTDNTAKAAREMGAVVLNHEVRGYGQAYKAGFAIAKGDIIVTADADGSYPLEDLPEILKDNFEDKFYEFVVCNRFAKMDHKAMSRTNQVGNHILSFAMRMLYGINIKDSQSGMWIFKRDILKHLNLKSDNWVFSQEIKLEACYYHKYYWTEIPIDYHKRTGNSKLKAWEIGVNDLYHLFKKRFE